MPDDLKTLRSKAGAYVHRHRPKRFRKPLRDMSDEEMDRFIHHHQDAFSRARRAQALGKLKT